MHHIYHTEGLILGSKNYREADKYFHIFTRDLGMIYASAQGIRKLSSKLRFVLQDFSYAKLDLVKGKDFWRITSASKINKLEKVSKKKETLEIVFNISQLLKRLIIGEDLNKKLFDVLLNGLSFLEKYETTEDLKNIEAIIVLRLLNNLGYIGDAKINKEIVNLPLGEELILKTSKNKKFIFMEINKALKESHL